MPIKMVAIFSMHAGRGWGMMAIAAPDDPPVGRFPMLRQFAEKQLWHGELPCRYLPLHFRLYADTINSRAGSSRYLELPPPSEEHPFASTGSHRRSWKP